MDSKSQVEDKLTANIQEGYCNDLLDLETWFFLKHFEAWFFFWLGSKLGYKILSSGIMEKCVKWQLHKPIIQILKGFSSCIGSAAYPSRM